MKRLLAYLFIVLGLGLSFSVNSHSAVYCVDDKIDERIANFKPDYPKRENEFFYFSEQSGACIGSYSQVTYEQYNYFKNLFSREKLKIAKTEPSQSPVELLKNLTKLYEDGVIDKSQFEKTKKKILLIDDIQIAKAEASKAQKINNIKAECKEQIGWDGEVRSWIICKKEPKEIKNTVKVTKKEPKKIKKENIKAECKEQIGWDGEVRSWIICEKKPSQFTKKETKKKAKIAKIEETKKEEYITIKGKGSNENVFNHYFLNLAGNPTKDTKMKLEWVKEDSCIAAQNNAFKQALKNTKGDTVGLNNHVMLRGIKEIKEIFKKNTIKNTNKNTVKIIRCDIEVVFKIAGPALNFFKKNKKVEDTDFAKVKVEDLKKQEEFKPESKDNEAPVIEIAEAITVNDSTYEIEGKVIDKSKKLFVQIDGETLPVKKGKFKIKRFSPIDEQLKIVAIDQWGNKSKPKIVNVTVDIKETIVADKLEQLNPSLIKSRSNKNRVALIIGIEKYEQTPAANFANLDAQYFYEYARKGFGIPKANIKLLVDEEASLIKSISTINKWLPSKIKNNQTELIIFFAGHGLASNNGEELYILPQDSDPDLLSRTALSRTELFEQIIKLNPKSVTMFMDTCYSGISRDEKMLLASARPIRIVADDQEGIPDNFTIFTASKLDQISSGLKEAEHGIFSYYLMKGLEGKADSNQDKKITNGELLSYMDDNVSQKAAELGREQNPSLSGDPDKVLISYR